MNNNVVMIETNEKDAHQEEWNYMNPPIIEEIEVSDNKYAAMTMDNKC